MKMIGECRRADKSGCGLCRKSGKWDSRNDYEGSDLVHIICMNGQRNSSFSLYVDIGEKRVSLSSRSSIRHQRMLFSASKLKKDDAYHGDSSSRLLPP